jgi:hypothetical protein
MDKDFVPYPPSLDLKELGFNEDCFGWYNWTGKDLSLTNNSYVDINPTPAPTFSQAFRWFREKYDLHPSFTRYKSSSINREPTIFTHLYEIQIIDENADKIFHVGDFNSLEEAELECLKKLIEIVKDKK